jgi:RNA polymerase sigma factor (sigma-70 family)
MASVNSTYPEPAPARFPAEFVANIPQFKDMVRRRGAMRWAKQYGLEDDLEQLALLEIARIVPKFDPGMATSLDHFVGACLNRCLTDCIRMLKRGHREIVDGMHYSIDAPRREDAVTSVLDEVASLGESMNPVFEEVVRTQVNVQLRSACALLPPRQREVIELVLSDYTDKEISEEIGVTVQSVNKSRLGAIVNLRRLLPGAPEQLN